MAMMTSTVTVDIVVKVPNITKRKIGVRLICFIAKLFGIKVEVDARMTK